jgi:hypothetical protein
MRCTGPTARRRAARRRAQLAAEATVKLAVRLRDHDRCRVCGRPGQSVHELDPKGMGGSKTAVSLENSIVVCGDGTRGCHSLLQTHRLIARAPDGGPPNAEDDLVFSERTR